MHHIKKLAEQMEDEINSAMHYAEKYIEYKAKGNTAYATKFKAMSEDELRHALFFHEIAVKEIEEVSKVYTAPAEMLEKWEHEHKEYIERVALVKQILSM